MTKQIFMLSIDESLNMSTLSMIFKSGYSRIPIYEKDRNDILGIILTKDMLFIDPKEEILVRSFFAKFARPLQAFFEDQKLHEVKHVHPHLFSSFPSFSSFSFLSSIFSQISCRSVIQFCGFRCYEYSEPRGVTWPWSETSIMKDRWVKAPVEPVFFVLYALFLIKCPLVSIWGRICSSILG